MDAKYISEASLNAHGADWCQWIIENLERAHQGALQGLGKLDRQLPQPRPDHGL